MWSSSERSPVSLLVSSPRRRHHVGHIDPTVTTGTLSLLYTDNYHLLLLLPSTSSSLTAIRGRNNHIDRADRSGQESGNMNSHMCQRQSEEEEEEGWTDISVCLIVALILWQWHTVNSNSESLRPPGPINAQELVCWHFYTDVLTSNTVEQERLRLTVLNYISTYMDEDH